MFAAISLVAAPASAQTSGDFFVGDIPENGGPTMLTMAGGSFDDLDMAMEAQGFETVFTTVGGEWVGYALDVPDFVNERFEEAFGNQIPEGTPVLVNAPGGGVVPEPPDEAMTFTADLETINESVQDDAAMGTATFTVDGDMLTVEIEATGLAPDMAHAQHIHMTNACPTMAADENDDGVVDIAEGVPSYGDVLVTLDDDLLDTEANTFPMADADGNLSYTETVSISELESVLGEALALDTRTVVQHGVAADADLPNDVDGALLPVDCGVIGGGDGSGGMDEGAMSFSTEIGPVNEQAQGIPDATGTATFTVDGDELTVNVEASGLEENIGHAQHIHFGTSCPNEDADVNEDDYVDVAEGVPAYGAIMLPLDDDLEDTAANNFPTADEDGNLSYTVTASVSALESALGESLDLGTRSYVVHGINPMITLPETIATIADLPEHATLPVGCGDVAEDAGAGMN